MWDTSRAAEIRQMTVPPPPMMDESEEQPGEMESIQVPTDNDIQPVEGKEKEMGVEAEPVKMKE
jgi:hypothetical protein